MPRNNSNKYAIIFGDSKNFVSCVYMDDIPDMKFDLHHLHLDQLLFPQKHDHNFQILC